MEEEFGYASFQEVIVYLTENILNRKVYVGQAVHNKSYYLGSGKLIRNAIKKYGKENFRKTVLVECSSREEMDFCEMFLICALDARVEFGGYNLVDGGQGCHDMRHTEDFKRKRSGPGNPMFGRKRPEHSARMKLRMAGKNNPCFMRKPSQANLEHLRQIAGLGGQAAASRPGARAFSSAHTRRLHAEGIIPKLNRRENGTFMPLATAISQAAS